MPMWPGFIFQGFLEMQPLSRYLVQMGSFDLIVFHSGSLGPLCLLDSALPGPRVLALAD